MPVRSQPIDSEAAGFEAHGRRLRSLEDAAKSRMLPPGYHFRVVAGSLVIVREADDATATLDFA